MMKNCRIRPTLQLLSATAIALCIAGCQENTLYSQGEIEPDMATDALEVYVADPLSPEEVSFSVSSNTPWKITVDCGEEFAERPWLSVSPSLSAVSSLVEKVTVSIKDNNTYTQRVASITINADGVDQPTIVTIKQGGLGNLNLSALTPQGEISKDGGQTSFTVVSNRDWIATTTADWLQIDRMTGEASEEPQTITVTAPASDGLRRSAIITVKTELEEKTIEIAQEGMRLDLVSPDDPETAFAFPYGGESRTYYVNANIDWTVSTDNPNATAEKIDNTSFTLTVPFARSFQGETITVEVKPEAADSPLPAKTFTVSQESAVTKDCGIIDGNTITADESTGNKARLKTRGNYKFGEFIWTFSDVNISPSAYFSLNNWSGSIYLMLQFGDTVHRLNTGGEVNVNGNTICFGFDNGWGGRWNDTKSFTDGTYPTSASELKSLRLLIEPTKRSGTQQNETLSRKVWINDVLVLDNSTNVGNVWCDGSTQDGFNYLFGIEGGSGTMTIDSFEYKPL